MYMYLHILNQRYQIQSICLMVNSSYTFRHDIYQSTSFLGRPVLEGFFFHLNKITSNSFILFIDFLYKSKISDTRYLPGMHDDELVVIFRQDAIYAFQVTSFQKVLCHSLISDRDSQVFYMPTSKLKSRIQEKNLLFFLNINVCKISNLCAKYNKKSSFICLDTRGFEYNFSI